MKKLLIATAVVATFFVPQAFAQTTDKGGYLGFGLGQSTIKLDSTDFSYLTSKNETDTAYKIYGGMQFNDHFAAELGYVKHGKATGSVANISETYDVSSLSVAVVGILPLGDAGFSLLGKLGATSNSVKDAISGGLTYDATKTSSDVLYGIGVRYAFNKNFVVRAEYEDFGKAGEQATGRSRLSLASVNVEYKF